MLAVAIYGLPLPCRAALSKAATISSSRAMPDRRSQLASVKSQQSKAGSSVSQDPPEPSPRAGHRPPFTGSFSALAYVLPRRVGLKGLIQSFDGRSALQLLCMIITLPAAGPAGRSFSILLDTPIRRSLIGRRQSAGLALSQLWSYVG